MHPTGIVAALRAEARALGPLARAPGRPEDAIEPRGSQETSGFEIGSLADGSLLAVTGMGWDAAALGAHALAERGCAGLLSWGLAGGLDPALPCGTIVVPAHLLADGANALAAAAPWRDRITEWLSRDPRLARRAPPALVGGSLLTSRRALTSAAEKQAAARRSGAVAVDMESYAVAAVAAARGIPFLAIRVIVDAAGDAVPPILGETVDARGRISVGKLAAAIAAAPGLLASLLRLARRYRTARRTLQVIASGGALRA